MPTTLHNGPDIDRIIDGMLTSQPDSLDPGKFPSLGFEGEVSGSYFMQIKREKIMVSIWRIIAANGQPESYHIHTYHRQVFINGVTSWGGDVTKKLVADNLLHAQALIHHIFTSEGNDDAER